MAEKVGSSEGREEICSTEGVKENALDDDELDSLLNDALQDFTDEDAGTNHRLITDPQTRSSQSKPDNQRRQSAEFRTSDLGRILSEEDLAQMTEQLSVAFKDFPTSDLFSFGKQCGTHGPLFTGPDTTQSLDENIDSAWKSLEQNLRDTQSEEAEDFLEKDFMSAFQGLGLEDAQLDPGNFMSALQGMMSTFLSKDVLYPSLKEMQSKYPGWLEENKSKIGTDDYGRYERQQELVTRICCEFEDECENDSDERKKSRMDKIMDLMQKMQDCGQPPMDLLGKMDDDTHPGMRSWPTGVPTDRAGDEQCVCM